MEAFERDELPGRFDAWRKSQAAPTPSWVILDPAEYRSQGGATLTPVGDGSLLASGTNPDFDTYTIVVQTDLANITAVRVEALADPSLVKNGPGRAITGTFISRICGSWRNLLRAAASRSKSSSSIRRRRSSKVRPTPPRDHRRPGAERLGSRSRVRQGPRGQFRHGDRHWFCGGNRPGIHA